MKRTTIFADDQVPEDPIEASKGILKGKTSLLNTLLEDRREEGYD